MNWFPFCKVVKADVVLLPICEGDDVVYLHNEPVFFAHTKVDHSDFGHWFIMSSENCQILVYPARKSVFLGYYAVWED